MELSSVVTLKYNTEKWLDAQNKADSEWLSNNNSPTKMVTLNYRRDRLDASTPALSPVPWMVKKEFKPRKPKYNENDPFLIRPVSESLQRLREYEKNVQLVGAIKADINWYHDLTNVAQRLRLLRDTYKVLQAVRKKRAMGERVDFRTAHEFKSRTGSPVPLDENASGGHPGDEDAQSRQGASLASTPVAAPARRGRPRKRGGGAGRGRKPGPRLRTVVPLPMLTATRSRASRRKQEAAEAAAAAGATAASETKSGGDSRDSRDSTPALTSDNAQQPETSLLTQFGTQDLKSLLGLSQPDQASMLELGSNPVVTGLMPEYQTSQAQKQSHGYFSFEANPPENVPVNAEQQGLADASDLQLMDALTTANAMYDNGASDAPGVPDPGARHVPLQRATPQEHIFSELQHNAQWEPPQQHPGVPYGEYYPQSHYQNPSVLSELTMSIIENLKRKNPSGLVLASLYNRPGGFNFSPQWAAQQEHRQQHEGGADTSASSHHLPNDGNPPS